MYFVWFLAAACVLVLGISLRKLLARPEKRLLSPFHQTRPVPDLKSPADSEMVDAAQAKLLKLAGADAAFQPRAAASIVRPTHNSFAAQGSMNSMSSSASSATIPISSFSGSSSLGSSSPGSSFAGGNRLSTWDNRRLFSDFRGILNDDAESLPTPTPEELPIENDQFVFGSLTPAIAQLLPETARRREIQRRNLTAAGYHSRGSWLNLAAIRFVLSFLSLAIVGFWLIMAPAALEPWLLALLVVLPILMWALPPLVVAFKADERKIDIDRGLPDVLDMMNMGVSQGLTVPQSLKRITKEIADAHPALSEEFRIVSQQAEVGSLAQALRNFSQRIDSTEVNSFTTLLVQSETTGTSISRALADYSDSIRATLKERADARANAASFKLLFPVALFLMPSVFLFLLGPAIVQLSDFFGSQAQQLQDDRRDALRSLDQQPQLDMQRLTAPRGQFGGQ